MKNDAAERTDPRRPQEAEPAGKLPEPNGGIGLDLTGYYATLKEAKTNSNKLLEHGFSELGALQGRLIIDLQSEESSELRFPTAHDLRLDLGNSLQTWWTGFSAQTELLNILLNETFQAHCMRHFDDEDAPIIGQVRADMLANLDSLLNQLHRSYKTGEEIVSDIESLGYFVRNNEFSAFMQWPQANLPIDKFLKTWLDRFLDLNSLAYESSPEHFSRLSRLVLLIAQLSSKNSNKHSEVCSIHKCAFRPELAAQAAKNIASLTHNPVRTTRSGSSIAPSTPHTTEGPLEASSDDSVPDPAEQQRISVRKETGSAGGRPVEDLSVLSQREAPESITPSDAKQPQCAPSDKMSSERQSEAFAAQQISVDEVFEDFVGKSAPELRTMLRRRYYARHYEILFPQPVPDKIDESCLTGGGRNSGLSSSVPWEYFERVEELMSEFKTSHPNRIARFRT